MYNIGKSSQIIFETQIIDFSLCLDYTTFSHLPFSKRTLSHSHFLIKQVFNVPRVSLHAFLSRFAPRYLAALHGSSRHPGLHGVLARSPCASTSTTPRSTIAASATTTGCRAH